MAGNPQQRKPISLHNNIFIYWYILVFYYPTVSELFTSEKRLYTFVCRVHSFASDRNPTKIADKIASVN
jgi:hypothetical protein